jgi:hypothetical protein
MAPVCEHGGTAADAPRSGRSVRATIGGWLRVIATYLVTIGIGVVPTLGTAQGTYAVSAAHGLQGRKNSTLMRGYATSQGAEQTSPTVFQVSPYRSLTNRVLAPPHRGIRRGSRRGA